MKVENLTYKDITKEIVNSLLYEGIAYEGQYADIAIVLGSNKALKYRIPVACDLYESGKVKKFIFSGGRMLSSDGIKCEAEIMKEGAIKYGIKPGDIFTETDSKSTKENLVNSYNFINNNVGFDKIKKIIIVTAGFHMKRSLLLARKLFPDNVEIIPCPASDVNTRKETWDKSPAGYERAVGEVIGIANYAQAGDIDSFEV